MFSSLCVSRYVVLFSPVGFKGHLQKERPFSKGRYILLLGSCHSRQEQAGGVVKRREGKAHRLA